MHSVFIYYLCLVLLVLAMSAAWGATLFALPGNWGIVGLAAVFAVLFPAGADHGLRWSAVGIAAGLALVGEVIEFPPGRQGPGGPAPVAARPIYALFGTIVGSIVGAMVTIPIPIIGPIIGALGGGAIGRVCAARSSGKRPSDGTCLRASRPEKGPSWAGWSVPSASSASAR